MNNFYDIPSWVAILGTLCMFSAVIFAPFMFDSSVEPKVDWEAIQRKYEERIQLEWEGYSFTKKNWLYYPPFLFILLLPITLHLLNVYVKVEGSWVLHSNDGPLGVANSAWLSGPAKEGLGAAVWFDTWWLGCDGGSVPFNSGWMLFSSLMNPQYVIPAFVLCWFIGWVLFFYWRPRKIDYDNATNS